MKYIFTFDRPFNVIGLSYVLFRILQLLVDAYQGDIKEKLSPLRTFNYLFFFPSFLSGPIQRYQDYRDQENDIGILNLSSETVYEAFSRITNGLLKVVMLSAIFQIGYNEAILAMKFNVNSLLLGVWYCLACMAYLLQLYISFSGYIDVVIGVGRLFGFTLPENFNWPLSAKNFLEFWSRWHISLSYWFKLYLFNPIVKALNRRYLNPKVVPYYGVVAFFVTFFIMGLWHGTTPVFVVYGLFLGLGVSINKLYEVVMRKYLGKKRFAGLRLNKFYSIFCQSLTITYFAIALTCLWLNMTGLLKLFEDLGLSGLSAAVGLCIALTLMGIFISSLIRIFANFMSKHLRVITSSFWLRQLGLSGRLLILIFALFSQTAQIPVIQYIGF
jgi:D-alanyl-lipoteichoic acid acyltransferase DltB (MBOAT superfamily)